MASKESKFTDAQKAFIIKQSEEGTPVAYSCRKAGISQETPVSLLANAFDLEVCRFTGPTKCDAKFTCLVDQTSAITHPRIMGPV